MTERHYGVLIFSLGLLILFQSLAIGHDTSRLERPALTILMPMEVAPAGPEPAPSPVASAPAAASSSQELAVSQAIASQGLFVEPAPAPPVEDLTYTMQKGDTFYAVATQFGMSARDLASANGLARPWAPTGTVLRIPRQRPQLAMTEEEPGPAELVMTYRVRPGDTLANIAGRFHMGLSDLLTENKIFSGKEPAVGKTLRVRIPPIIEYRVGEGESLWKVSKTYQVALGTLVELNNLALADLKPGQVIQVPIGDPALLDRIWRERHPEAKKAETNRFVFPLAGRITDRYGYRIHPIQGDENFHSGVDIAAPHGAPIRCSRPGTVQFVGWKPGYGKVVVVRHSDGSQSWYAHCSRLIAKTGNRVKAGAMLARVGATGSATGPHLHFEIRRNETPVNPMKYLGKSRA